MSVRFDVAGDCLSDATNVIDYNAPYTWMGYVRKVANTGLNEFIRAYTSASGNDGRDSLYVNASNQLVGSVHTGTNTDTAGSTITVGTDYNLTIVRESTTSFKVYLNGVLDITITTNVTGRTASNKSWVGNYEGAARLFNARLSWMKEWTIGLSADEIKAEMTTIRPLRWDSLYRWVPVWDGAGNRGQDYSGNARHFTENGTLTDEESVPLTWGGSVQLINQPATGGGTTITVADTGAGADALAQLAVQVGVADTGVGVDAGPSPAVGLTLADTGTGVDSLPVLSVSIALTDSGIGADTIQLIADTIKTITDLASGVDAINISAVLQIGDTAIGLDTAAITALLSVIDGATGADSAIASTLVAIADAGAGADSITVSVMLSIADAGVGADGLSIAAALALIDSATGYDAVLHFDTITRIASIKFTPKQRATNFTAKQRTIKFTLH